ncbi:MAG: TIGR04348 family glycosyltransferase [Gemmatimonadetes bacterium]|nr:TIGR04348 family glycosyltransferase [Gemmatimonadota bacterium]
MVTPAGRGARSGNRVTATRWATLLREIGHEVSVGTHLGLTRCDLLVAVHARKSHAAVEAFHARHPRGPIVLLLAGTDLYADGPENRSVAESMRSATRLVVLQPLARRTVPRSLHRKVRVIRQSAMRPAGPIHKRAGIFEVCVIGHLRSVKDPLRTAYAARQLPQSSQIQVVHVGGALSADMERRARRESQQNSRYRWMGSQPQKTALRILARSRVLALTSRAEGGANVISEAIACGVPVIASRVDGSVGLLGRDYPAYFPVGDTAFLAGLLERVERDGRFLADLSRRCRELRPVFLPSTERAAWRALLAEL